MTTISQSVRNFETWLAGELGDDLVEDDLREKHEKMRSGDFVFLRATYWRWCEIILDICPELTDAPEVLAIGDTHLENFGTWRDVEGRLVWGINDFDDAAVMPYGLDLVRLAASAVLARGGDGPSVRMIGELILSGYRRGLENPLPVILERDHKWLRKSLLLPNSERREFWEKYEMLLPGSKPAPSAYTKALADALPAGAGSFVPKPRSGGTGSLGRPRFVAYAEWQGGPVLREAKALLPSTWSLRHNPQDVAIHADEIANGRARSADPHYRVSGRILVRRLAEQLQDRNRPESGDPAFADDARTDGLRDRQLPFRRCGGGCGDPEGLSGAGKRMAARGGKGRGIERQRRAESLFAFRLERFSF